MDWVDTGGPWTGSTKVVHGLGPQGWSMVPGPCFVYVPHERECCLYKL